MWGCDKRMAWKLLGSGLHVAQGLVKVPQLQSLTYRHVCLESCENGTALRSPCLPLRDPKPVGHGGTGIINMPSGD